MVDTLSKMAEYILCYYGFLFNCFPATAQITFLPHKTDMLFPSCGKLKSTVEGSTPKYSVGIYLQVLPTLPMDQRLVAGPTSLRNDMYICQDNGQGRPRSLAKSIKAASYGTAMATRIKLSSVQQNTGKGTIKMSQIAKPWESSNGGLPVP